MGSCSNGGLAKLCCILVVVGAINWGLIGLAGLIGSGSNWNVVNLLLGSWPVVENIVYLLVGLAGVKKLLCCSGGSCSK